MERGRIDEGRRKLGNLIMIWRYALRYKGTIAGAGLALLVAAGATLAIPDGFRRVIDKGFTAAGSGAITPHFNDLFVMVVVLGIATALRFYFVSMLGERVIADIRGAVHDNLLRLEPRFFEENRPSEIASRVTSDTAVIEIVVGSTVSVALRNIVLGIGGIIYLFTLAPMLTAGLLVGIPLIIVPVVCRPPVRLVSRHSKIGSPISARSSPRLWRDEVVQAFGQEAREQPLPRGP